MANLSPVRPDQLESKHLEQLESKHLDQLESKHLEQLESKQLEQQINALGATGRPAGHPGYVETLFPDL